MNDRIEVRALAPSDEPAWDAFVATAPDAGFFHRAGWRRVIEHGCGHRTHYRYAVHDGAVAGVLPFVHVRSPLFGNALISTGFCVEGGIAANDEAAMCALAENAKALGAELGVDHVELRHRLPLPIGTGWTERSDLYAVFRRPLSAGEAENLKAIPRKKRADVRKSLGNGLRVDSAADVDDFFRVYAESVRDLGIPVRPRRFFRALVAAFGDAAEVSLVHGPDGPVAALISFFFRDQVLPYFGGALPAARALHAYDFMYWSLMCRAAARGVRLFDFGRSKRGTGAFDYKTFWGFTPESLHYQFHPVRRQALPDVNPLNPKYRLLVAAWRRLPLALANRVGPLIARQLG